MDSDGEYQYEEDGDDEYNYEYNDDEDGDAQPSSAADGKDLGKVELKRENSTFHIPYDDYIIKPSGEIALLMRSLIRDVCGLLGTGNDEALILLQSFKWDKEKVMNEYFADVDKVRQDCGLDAEPSGNVPTCISSELCECRICYDRLPMGETSALGCGHRFCNSCYGAYLFHQIGEGPPCVLAKCPQHKCTSRVHLSLVEKLVPQDLFERYEEYLVRNYIDTCKHMRHCPAARCDKVAVGSGVLTIGCTCGTMFCFKCGEDAHEPASCQQLQEWKDKCANESETANWILVNTRKCPQCNTRIEKNQGCNHMSCKICKHEFCWICMGNWHSHGQETGGFYKCNRFTAAENNVAVTEAQRAKAELDRYLHYYQRYHGHDHALQFAIKQITVVERRLNYQADAKGLSYVDNEYILHAAQQVVAYRRVLKFTYVLGYFLKDNTAEKQLFEHQQEMLEKHTERLQEYMEMPSESLDSSKVNNLIRVTGNFMASVLSTMTGGVVRIEEMQTSPDKVKP